MNKKMRIIFPAAILLLVLFKQWLIGNLPIEARHYQTDDLLMVKMTQSLISRKWLGDYKGQLLMKGCFFPIFLAAVNFLKWNYLSALNIANALAALFFVYQLRGFLKSPILRFILFTVLLFDPCTYSQTSFQRVYRSSIVEMEVLFLWGAYYGIFMRASELKDRIRFSEILLILFSGGVLWGTWNTREECFWMLPFIITATVLIVIRYLKTGREKNWSKKLVLVRCGMLLVPFLLLFAGNQGIRALNKHYYGEAVRLEIADGAFKDALNSIYSVKNEKDVPHVTVTREKLERIMAISPALEQIRPELEAELERYDKNSDRSRNDGEVEDGWLYWALKYAAFNNGVADSLPKSEAYWKTVHEEVEAALNDPASSLERQSVMPSVLMSPFQEIYRRWIPGAMEQAIKHVLSYEGAYPLSGSSGKAVGDTISLFESITHNTVVADNEAETGRAAQRLPHLSTAVKWLVGIGDFYRALNPMAVIMGLGCFLAIFIVFIIKKQQGAGSAVLILSGMFFSSLIIIAGVAYTHISAFPAIMTHYLAGAYPLMLGTAWFSILYWAQMLVNMLIKSHGLKDQWWAGEA